MGEHAFRATGRAIAYEPHEPVTAKGKAEPLLVWRAVARRASFGIDLADARSPLVGRDDERDVLVRALGAHGTTRAAARDRRGVPGIGSRDSCASSSRWSTTTRS